jgi:hypothetical protein
LNLIYLKGDLQFMHKLKTLALAVSLVFFSGLLLNAHAQTTTTNTIVYKLDGQQVALGGPDATTGTYFVTYAGSVGGPNSKAVSVKSYSLTIVYSVAGGAGTIVGGQWSLLVLREGIATTLGGPVNGGAAIPVRTDNTVGSTPFTVNFDSNDPTWPVTGVFTATVDNKSRPPKISGPVALTFPVVVR